VIITVSKLHKKNIVWGIFIAFTIFSMSYCKTKAIPPPSAGSEEPPLIAVIQKIKRNSSEIKKYLLFNKIGELVVKADIEEKDNKGNTEYFQVLYDMKRAIINSSGEYLITFVLKNMETGESYEDKLLWKPQKDDSGILLSFDDHYRREWENYFGLFDRYNAKVTFFVTGTYNINSYFSRVAQSRGHDVGYHSLNHFRLSEVSREDFYIQTISQVNNFRNMDVPLVSFAYPYGLYRPWMHDELLKTFKIVRGYNICFQVYDRQAIREGFIFAKSIDNTIFRYEDEFIAVIDIMFKTVKFTEQNLILPISSHDISNKISWCIKPHRLEYILQKANELQLNFYRYSDFF
jgi:peptidoglycan/xylan/chitin deacetylase (PgdA/CDA1 family)